MVKSYREGESGRAANKIKQGWFCQQIADTLQASSKGKFSKYSIW